MNFKKEDIERIKQQTDPRHNQHFVEPTRYGTWEKNGREIDF